MLTPAWAASIDSAGSVRAARGFVATIGAKYVEYAS